MFLNTADMNYVGARAAFFERREHDFWWLTLHAVEKYLKAALLMNGQTANEPNHNLMTLTARLRKLDSRLVLPAFTRPALAGAEKMFDFHNADFVKWLNIYGSAPNRYATYSYVISDLDLFRADHLIYWARRHVRLLRQTLPDGQVIDWVKELAESPSLWRDHSGAPLERLADQPGHSSAKRSFVRANVAFFPNKRHRPVNRGGGFTNGGIFNVIQNLKNSVPGSPDREEMRQVLTWVLEHIFLPKVEVAEIRKIMDDHP